MTTKTTTHQQETPANDPTVSRWQRHRNFIICHGALLLCQLIFATNLTLTRAAFQFTHGVVVSPMVIVIFRALIAFSVIAICFHREAIVRAAVAVRRYLRNCVGSDGGDDGSNQGEAATTQLAEEAPIGPAAAPIPNRIQLRIAFLGFIAIAVNLTAFTYGIKLTDALTAGAFQCAVPPLCLALSAVLRIERFSVLKLLSVTLAIVGNAIMVSAWEMFSSSKSRPTSYYIGSGLLLVNVGSWSTFIVLQKPILATVPRLTFLYYFYRAGAACIVVLALLNYEVLVDQVFTRLLPFWFIVIICYTGFITAVVPYFLTAMAVTLSSPAVVATYSVLQPLLVAVEAVLFLNESLSGIKVIGGLTALAAVAVAATSQYRDAAKREAAIRAAAAQCAADHATAHNSAGSAATAHGDAHVEMKTCVAVHGESHALRHRTPTTATAPPFVVPGGAPVRVNDSESDSGGAPSDSEITSAGSPVVMNVTLTGEYGGCVPRSLRGSPVVPNVPPFFAATRSHSATPVVRSRCATPQPQDAPRVALLAGRVTGREDRRSYNPAEVLPLAPRHG